MADTPSVQTDLPRWSWPWSALSGWPAWPALAPQSNTQDINSGWSFGNFTVNSFNSSAPDVERAVVSRHSYGRQIGRLMDAVAALADALPKTAGDERIVEFRALAQKVAAIKKEMAPERLARLKREVAELRATDEPGFEELKKMFK